VIRVFVVSHDLLPEVAPQYGDLDGPACNQVVVPDGAPVVRLKETHKEAEADEDHNVNVLEASVVVLY